jgi:hypothetical protein
MAAAAGGGSAIARPERVAALLEARLAAAAGGIRSFRSEVTCKCDRVVGDASIVETVMIAADAGGDEPCR